MLPITISFFPSFYFGISVRGRRLVEGMKEMRYIIYLVQDHLLSLHSTPPFFYNNGITDWDILLRYFFRFLVFRLIQVCLYKSLFSLPPRVFGCVCFVHFHLVYTSDKFSPRARAVKCVFLGYSRTQKGYKCYDPISGKFYVSADVTFF